jgi:hypothetical protein
MKRLDEARAQDAHEPCQYHEPRFAGEYFPRQGRIERGIIIEVRRVDMPGVDVRPSCSLKALRVNAIAEYGLDSAV